MSRLMYRTFIKLETSRYRLKQKDYRHIIRQYTYLVIYMIYTIMCLVLYI